MTALVVFEQIWAQHIAGGPLAVPLVGTINVPIDWANLPDLWASPVDWVTDREDLTLGSRPWVRTTGRIGVGLFRRSGTGAHALDGIIAEVRRVYAGAALDGLHVLKVTGPELADEPSDGEWWRQVLSCEYEFIERRTAGISPPAPLDGWQGFPA